MAEDYDDVAEDNTAEATPQQRYLAYCIQQRLDFLQSNGIPDATEDDALEELMEACGRTQGGGCEIAGTEFCDFECAFRDDEDEEDGSIAWD